MPQSQVSIKFPREKNFGPLGMHTQFAAFGVASGTIEEFKAYVSKLDGTFVADARRIQLLPRKGRLLPWFAEFILPSTGFFILTIEGLDKLGNAVDKQSTNMYVEQDLLRANPEIAYPSTNQNVIDERDYFVAYGSRSATAVSAATVTPAGESAINGVVYDNGSDFWSAVFDLTSLEPDLPTIELAVTGAGITTRNICIMS